jgi:hypothetical protein
MDINTAAEEGEVAVMTNVVCIKHRDYQGITSPNLMCRACCGIYVARVKAEVDAGKHEAAVTATEWLEQKANEIPSRQATPAPAPKKRRPAANTSLQL